VYILEAIGSLIGGILFTFVLISRFQPFTITLLFNCILFLNISLILLFFDKSFLKKRKFVACMLLFIFTSFLLVSGVVNRVDNYFVNVRWRSSNPDIKLLESIDSRYENIVIGVRDDQYSIYGNGQYKFGFPSDYENSQIAHLVMTQHPNPKNVLLIGGGMGGMIREILKHPIDELDYIELDPALIESTKKYLPPDEIKALSDKRVKVFHIDGRYFVKRTKGKKKYDLIFVNVPDPSTAFLNRFYTLQFFQEGKDILEEDGVFATGISSTVNYLGEEVGNYTGSIYQTLSRVFPNVIITPGQINYYFASNSYYTATFDIQTLTKRYVGRNVKSEFFSEYVFYSLLPPERIDFVTNEIKSRKGLMLNTDTKPVTYFFNLMLWDKLSDSQLGGILQWLKKSHLKTFLIPVFVFLVCRIVYVVVFRRSLDVQQKFNCVAAISTTGFAALALEIILIYVFQNVYGYVYEKIGLIIAVFMFGLALGGSIGNRLIRQRASMKTSSKLNFFKIFINGNKEPQNHKKENIVSVTDEKKILTEGGEQKQLYWVKVLIILEFIIVVYTCIMPFVLHQLTFLFFDSEYLFMFLVVITGVLTGLEFPISSKLYLLRREDLGVTAGAIDSADHAGAFIGALFTGVLFVPLFGITGSCLIIVGLNLVSLLLLLHLYYHKKRIRNC
jgi:spermidine synthase